MTTAPLTTQVPLWRKIAAGVAGTFGAIALSKEIRMESLVVAIPVLSPVIAAVAVHRARLGPQLLARAIWWSNLGLGAILCCTGSRSDHRAGLVMTLGTGSALLLIGRKGLAEAVEREAFVPTAFRGSLLLLMVLALADAQSFGLFALLENDHSGDAAWALGLAAVAFIVGFIGLYRLALWGALVNMITAAALLIATLSGALRYTRDLNVIVPLLAGAQLLVGVPMLVTLVSRKPLPELSPRARSILAPVAVILLMIISISVGLERHGL